jgi:very-short-patch-repair endonuclease/DNA-directed RNA polymerase subunit RPC12/RpoP
MHEVIPKQLIIDNYWTLGPQGMAKKFGHNARYYVRRASIMKVKWNKPIGKRHIKHYCVDCGKQLHTFFTGKPGNHCHSCSAKRNYAKRGVFTSGNLFSPVEIEFLKKNFYDMTRDELCKHLNRTWASINHKGNRLGLKRNPKYIIEGNAKGRAWFKANNPMYTPEYKAKALYRAHQTLSRNQYHLSNLEARIAEYLNNEGIAYEHNPPINTGKTIRFPDFRIGKLLIEADGEFWHKNRAEEDMKRQRELEEAGYTVIRFTGKQIKENFEEVVQCIQQSLLKQ